MSTQTGPIQSGRIAEQPQARGGANLFLRIASLIAALVVGGVGGYFLAPTKTVTNTVTVTPNAYTTSSEVQAKATFDGATCAYSGPTELKAGTRLTLDYVSTATQPSGGVSVIGVTPETTWEQVAQAVTTNAANSPPAFVRVVYESEPRGQVQQTVTTPALQAGLWFVGCTTSPETTNRMFTGTILRVIAS